MEEEDRLLAQKLNKGKSGAIAKKRRGGGRKKRNSEEKTIRTKKENSFWKTTIKKRNVFI